MPRAVLTSGSNILQDIRNLETATGHNTRAYTTSWPVRNQHRHHFRHTYHTSFLLTYLHFYTYTIMSVDISSNVKIYSLKAIYLKTKQIDIYLTKIFISLHRIPTFIIVVALVVRE